MAKPKIRRAYCDKLGIVTADQIRRASLSHDPPEKYDLFCETLECRAANVRVIGVAYRTSAREGKKYKQAHFRHQDEHVPACPYHGVNDEDTIAVRRGNETEQNFRRRQARSKLTDFIDIFDPTPVDDHDRVREEAFNESSDTQANADRRAIKKEQESHHHSQNRTSYLDKLVDCYLEAKGDLPKEEFKALHINVKGFGEIPISKYFTQIKFAYPGIENRVLYGGATLINRYGEGFTLKFYDKIDELPVFLHISAAQMAEYRYRRYLSRVINHKVRYFKVFAIGNLKHNRDAIDLVVGDLRHLAIVLPPV